MTAAALAGCAGTATPDDGAPHSFSQVRFGRPKAVTDDSAPVAPTREASVAPSVTAPAPAGNAAPSNKMAEAAAPVAPAAISAPASGPVAGPADPTDAARRVDAYLAAQGFLAEDSDQGSVRVVVATRMAEPRRLEHEAYCSLEAMRRPDFSATNLTVKLAPGATGLTVGVQSSFVEVNTNLISGTLVREACHSRGLLEAGVRRAALGG
jgi:hypothetical protein